MVATAPGSGNETAPATIREALAAAFERMDSAQLCFGHGCDSAWDESVLLVLSACALPVDAGDEVLDLPVGEDARGRIERWLAARIDQRVPLPYLIGRAWFAGLEFHCDGRALVPRSPLGEVIGDGFAPWWGGEAPRRALDLCCGGGAIGIAAAVHQPQLEVALVDVDADALALAQENVMLHGVGKRVSLFRSDLFDGLAPAAFDIILCNPPYVDAADLAAMPPEFAAEPALGLAAGDDGLDLARRILREAAAWMNPRALLFLELGNSWEALDEELADQALTWLEFREGGHGVLVLRRDEVLEAGAALSHRP